MKVITDADSSSSEMASANSVLAALGLAQGVGPGTACPNNANGGSIPTSAKINVGVYGPFGDLRGNTFGTSIGATISGLGTIVKCGSNVVRTIAKTKVMVGGDPSGFDLFTRHARAFRPGSEVGREVGTRCARGL